MTNKISGYAPTEPVVALKGSNNGVTVADKTQGEAAGAAPSNSQSVDHVTLTDSARSLQKLEETIARTPVVNSEKVAALRQQINDGTYRISSARIAIKLLELEKGLK